MIGHDRCLARLHRLEEIGVGDEAQPLFPRVVGRGEGLGVIMVAEVRLQLVGQEFLDLLGLLARAAERDVLQADVLEAGALVGEIGRASCMESVCQYVWISVVAVSLKKKKK